MGETLSGHVVLGGFGTLGQQVAVLLRERGLEVVVVDTLDDPDDKTRAEELGCRYVQGDISRAHYLQRAGIARARCAILTTGNEQANLEAAITARRLNPTAPVVLRLFDETLVRHVESIFSVHALRSRLKTPTPPVSAALPSA